MSTMPPEPESSPYGPVTPGMVAHLRATGPWVRFLSILGFLLSGLIVLASFVIMAMGGTMFGLSEDAPGAAAIGLGIGVLYLAMAGLYVAISWFLHRYASSISAMKHAADLPTFTWAMESALHHQRRFWKLVGIVMIVSFVAYFAIIAIAMVVAVIGGVAGIAGSK